MLVVELEKVLDEVFVDRLLLVEVRVDEIVLDVVVVLVLVAVADVEDVEVVLNVVGTKVVDVVLVGWLITVPPLSPPSNLRSVSSTKSFLNSTPAESVIFVILSFPAVPVESCVKTSVQALPPSDAVIPTVERLLTAVFVALFKSFLVLYI